MRNYFFATGKKWTKIKLKEKEIDLKMSTLNNKISSSLNKIGFLSYNAYPDAAGEKSYSLCMLDSYNNGIILSNLFGVADGRASCRERV